MKILEYLWVGLKLVGVYFIVLAMAGFGENLQLYLRGIYVNASPVQLPFIYAAVTKNGIFLLAGIVLLTCTGIFVSKPRSLNDIEDS